MIEMLEVDISKWDRRFLTLALHIASWSKDPSTQVGCIIVDTQNRIISTGFNGPPRGVIDEFAGREEKLLSTIHAEENSLLFSHTNLKGFTAYVTAPCCCSCMCKLIQAGIAKVVVLKSTLAQRPPWDKSCKLAETKADECGIKYWCVDTDQKKLNLTFGD